MLKKAPLFEEILQESMTGKLTTVFQCLVMYGRNNSSHNLHVLWPKTSKIQSSSGLLTQHKRHVSKLIYYIKKIIYRINGSVLK